MTSEFDNAIGAAVAWQRAGTGAALATVVQTWGSAPRPVGSQLAINAVGDMVGSVSGGCVEGAVVAEALDLIGTKTVKILEFGVSDDEAFAVGLACGGQIRVLLEPLTETHAALADATARQEAVAYVVDTLTGAARVVPAIEYADRFRTDQSGFEADGTTFVGVHNPALRMVIVGAVHIAQALVPMAQTLGYDVTVVDPREAFASAARFPNTPLSHAWPDEALQDLGLDARTAVVTLTHDPKIDDPAIETALRSAAFYVGCLGSTRTHAKRVARLQHAGFSDAEIARIHGPVGLDIGSRAPAEIAVSILAEVTQSLRCP